MTEARGEALLAIFQVRPILIDRILEAQGNSEEVQELLFAISKGKKKDVRVHETDGMLMQEQADVRAKYCRDYRKRFLMRHTFRHMPCIHEALRCIIPLDHFTISQV